MRFLVVFLIGAGLIWVGTHHATGTITGDRLAIWMSVIYAAGIIIGAGTENSLLTLYVAAGKGNGPAPPKDPEEPIITSPPHPAKTNEQN